MGGHGRFRPANQRRGGGVLLPAAPASAGAGLSSGMEHHVPRLAGGFAAPQAAVQNDSGPQAGAQGQHHEVPQTPARALEILPYGSTVRVVAQQHRQVQPPAEQGRQIRPLQGDVGGVQHLSAGDGPRQADAHALRVPGRRSGGGEHLRRQIRQVRRKGLRPPEVQGAPRRRQKAARLVRQARLQVGAAHVDTDEESAHFCFRLPCSARRSTRWASSWAALKP